MKIARLLSIGVLWSAAAFAVATPVQAAQDIVYSARYYKRPGSKGTSRYHLYRINADGTKRRQITSGSADDYYPQWSPDGKKILFVRRDEKTSRDTLSLVNANGGAVTSLRTFATTDLGPFLWSPKGDVIAVSLKYRMPGEELDAVAVVLLDLKGRTKRIFRDAYFINWAPDGKRMLIWAHSGKRIYDEEKSSGLEVALSSTVWLDNQTVVGFPILRDEKPETDPSWNKLQLLNANGRLKKTVPLKWNTTAPNKSQVNKSQLNEDSPYPLMLLSRPLSRRTFCAAYETTEDDVTFFALADSHTGQLTPLAMGQFLEWAPDGQRFCTAPGQNSVRYDNESHVWTAPLRIGTITGDKFKNIVSGLVHVDGAHWRGVSR